MKEILIIPDVHGRTFWRDAIERHPDHPRIFLGDYVDPYTWGEGIDMPTAIGELESIIELKKKEPDRTILLYGNHCTHYLWDEAEKSTRYNEAYKEELQELYGSVEFKVAHQEGNYLFTHAGCTKKWFEQNQFEVPEGNIADFLNNLSLSSEGRRDLTDIGRSRGGYAPSGGPMWADWNDDFGWWYEELYPGLIQIFGHTQVYGPQNYKQKLWCLDCREAFILNTDEGTITKA